MKKGVILAGVFMSLVLGGYIIGNSEKSVKLFITKVAEPIGQYRAKKPIKIMEKVLEASSEIVKKNR